MLHPTMQIELKRPIIYGSKDDILKFLKDNNSLKQIMDDLTQME